MNNFIPIIKHKKRGGGSATPIKEVISLGVLTSGWQWLVIRRCIKRKREIRHAVGCRLQNDFE